MLVWIEAIVEVFVQYCSTKQALVVFCDYKATPSNINSSTAHVLEEMVLAKDGNGEGDIIDIASGGLA